jgi:CDP-paratose 2-epimerase
MLEPDWEAPKTINLGGGIENSMSLKELTLWCEDRFGQNEVLASQDKRPMDAPWIVMDSITAQNAWNWSVKTKIEQILLEIANHAEINPDWLTKTN